MHKPRQDGKHPRVGRTISIPAPNSHDHDSDDPVKDWLKTPRSLLYLGRYVEADNPLLEARYRMLILVLWARRYRERPIRAYWEELGKDLGVSKNTVRAWAYSLEKKGYLGIVRHKGPVRDVKKDQPGYRNERNTFDLRPFWKFLEECVEPTRQRQRAERTRRSDASNGALS